MRILILTQRFPYPPDNGSKIRAYNLLRGLAEHHQLTLVSFTDEDGEQVEPPELRRLCQSIYTLPWRAYDPRGMRAGLGLFSPKPRSTVDTYSPQMRMLIERVLSGGDYDLVIASELEMAGYFPAFRRLPAILEDLELGILHGQYFGAKWGLRRLRYGLTWFKYRKYVSRTLRYFYASTLVSEREREIFAHAFPGAAAEVIPNCVNLDEYAGIRVEPVPGTLVFAGSFKFFPNYEAMLWFTREVFPRVQRAVPEARLIITGDPGGKTLPAQEGVCPMGYVENVRPVVASAWVSLAPIWSGAGTRLKILEAMALGTPVVATSKGAEGIEASHGKEILLADSPEEFAGQVIRLLQDPALRSDLAVRACDLVSRKYHWGAVMPRFLNLVERAAAR